MQTPFDNIKQIGDDATIFWKSRDLSRIPEYSDYRKFQRVIEKAMILCQDEGKEIHDHFVQVDEMVQLGSGAFRKVDLDQIYASEELEKGATIAKIAIVQQEADREIKNRKARKGGLTPR